MGSNERPSPAVQESVRTPPSQMPVVKRIDAEITLKLGVMAFRPSHENNTIFPKTKKSPQSSKN